MRSGRTALAQGVHDLLDHAPAVAAALGAVEQIDVQVRGISRVGFRGEIVRVMIPGMDLLHPGPLGGSEELEKHERNWILDFKQKGELCDEEDFIFWHQHIDAFLPAGKRTDIFRHNRSWCR